MATKSHGMTNTSIYGCYHRMLQRCYNPNNPKYSIYGGRGITVCDRWRNSFEAFYEDMGDIPSNLSLDRINVNGNYCPENCRWATASQQCANRRLYSIPSSDPNRNISFRVTIRCRKKQISLSAPSLEDARILRDTIEFEKAFHSLLGL
jgi:hypothetical protein